MDYPTLPPMLHGLEWALLKGLMYGLVAVLALWTAGTFVERLIETRRRAAAARSRASSVTEERYPHSHEAGAARPGPDGDQAGAELAATPLRR